MKTIKELPKKWIQNGFYEPFEAYITDIYRSDGKVMVYPTDSEEDYQAAKADIYDTFDQANFAYQQKLIKAENLKDFITSYWMEGPDDSWLRKRFDFNAPGLKHFKEMYHLQERIIDAYRSRMLNIDGTSILIDEVELVRFFGTKEDAKNDDGELIVVLSMRGGTSVQLTLHDYSDKKLFYEFFGENKSGIFDPYTLIDRLGGLLDKK